MEKIFNFTLSIEVDLLRMGNKAGNIYFFIIPLFIVSIISSNILQAYSCSLKGYTVEDTQSATSVKSPSHEKKEIYYRANTGNIIAKDLNFIKIVKPSDAVISEMAIHHTIISYCFRTRNMVISMTIPDLIYPFNYFF